jgi:hypothetical protein
MYQSDSNIEHPNYTEERMNNNISTGEVKIQQVCEPQKMTFEEFCESQQFKTLVKEISEKTGKSIETVSANIIDGVLGTVSDTAVTGVTVVENLINNIVDILALLLKGTTSSVAGLGKDTIRLLTLSKGKK